MLCNFGESAALSWIMHFWMTIVMLNDTLIWQACPQLYGTVVHPLHRVIATIFHHTACDNMQHERNHVHSAACGC